jgi:hypothetical protein
LWEFRYGGRELEEMMSMMMNKLIYNHGGDTSIYSTLEKYIIDTINANPSSDIADMCKFKWIYYDVLYHLLNRWVEIYVLL